MTETTTEPTPPGDSPPPPPPPPSPPAPPLVRPRDDRVFRGVCAALARSTGTDPVLWRVLVVVLAVFGGTGLVLYLAGWLLIPEEGAAESAGERLVRGHRSGQGMGTLATVGLVALTAVAVLLVLGDGRGLVPLLVVGAIAYLVLRTRQESASRPGAPVGAATPGGTGWAAPPAWTAPPPDVAGAPPGWGPPPTSSAYGSPPQPAPPRPRSNLGLLTLGAVGVVVGLLLLAGQLGLDGVTASRVLAAALLVTGGGLLVGARWGRSRGLIALAVVLALALGATSSFDRRFETSAGDRVWAVDGSTDRRLGAGSATLDLRPLAGSERTVTVEGRVGVGELVVLVPEDLKVDVDAEVGLGELRLPGGVTDSGAGLDRTTELGPSGRRTVQLDLRVGLGTLEVRRVAAE